MFCSLAVLDPRVGHKPHGRTFSISVILTGSNWLFHGESCPCIDVMLSIQAVRGLPRLRAPCIVPFIISFSSVTYIYLKHDIGHRHWAILNTLKCSDYATTFPILLLLFTHWTMRSNSIAFCTLKFILNYGLFPGCSETGTPITLSRTNEIIFSACPFAVVTVVF